MPLLQPSLRRLNAIKRTPTGLVETGDPVECILGIPPRDDCLGGQRRLEEERDSKFAWALARKTKWGNFSCTAPSGCLPNHDLCVPWIGHDHVSNLIAQLLPIMYEVPSPIIRHYL